VVAVHRGDGRWSITARPPQWALWQETIENQNAHGYCHYIMFVRFRHQSSIWLSVSIVESRRIAGKLKHEHIAALGSIETTPTIAARITFWKRLHERFGKLGNRIDRATQARLMGAVHERIPMPTVDGQRALQRESLEAEEKFWADLHDMHADTVEGNKAIIAGAERKIAEAQAEMAKVAERRDAARSRRERFDRGEDVAGSGKRLTREDMIKIMGWTASDVRHVDRLIELDQIGATEELLSEIDKGRRGLEKSASRRVLRRQRTAV
jgi:hypothetical protein